MTYIRKDKPKPDDKVHWFSSSGTLIDGFVHIVNEPVGEIYVKPYWPSVDINSVPIFMFKWDEKAYRNGSYRRHGRGLHRGHRYD